MYICSRDSVDMGIMGFGEWSGNGRERTGVCIALKSRLEVYEVRVDFCGMEYCFWLGLN